MGKSQTITTSARVRNLWFTCAAAMIAAAYLSFVGQNSVNIPFWDDVALFKQDSGLVRWLLLRNNEHIIAGPKLIAASVELAFGHLDFKILCLIGAAFSSWLYFAMFRYALKMNLSVTGCIFGYIIVHSPVNWENGLWALASLQNGPAFLLSCLSIVIFLSQGRGYKSLKVGFLVVVSAAFSATGFIAAALLLGMGSFHYLDRVKLNRRMEMIFRWLSVSLFVGMAYLCFASEFHLGMIFSFAARLLACLGGYSYSNLIFGYGAEASFAAMVFGLVLLFLVARIIVCCKDGRVVWLSIFAISCIGAIAFSRLGLGYRQAASSRYSMYSLALVALCVVCVLSISDLRCVVNRILLSFVIAGVLIGSGEGVWRSIDRSEQLVLSRNRFLMDGSGLLRGDDMIQMEMIVQQMYRDRRFR